MSDKCEIKYRQQPNKGMRDVFYMLLGCHIVEVGLLFGALIHSLDVNKGVLLW